MDGSIYLFQKRTLINMFDYLSQEQLKKDLKENIVFQECVQCQDYQRR